MGKPKLPDTIRVCGKPMAVIAAEKGPLGSDRIGEINHQHSQITYDAQYSPAQIRDTILHEVIHTVDYTAKLELSEHQTHALAALLYGVLADNPEFSRWLIAEVK